MAHVDPISLVSDQLGKLFSGKEGIHHDRASCSASSRCVYCIVQSIKEGVDKQENGTKLQALLNQLHEPGWELEIYQVHQLVQCEKPTPQPFATSRAITDILISCGLIPALVKVMVSTGPTNEAVFYALASISIICDAFPFSPIALEEMTATFDIDKEYTKKNALAALSAGVVEPLIALANGSRTFMERCRAIGAIVSLVANDIPEVSQALLNGNIIHTVKQLLDYQKIIDDAKREGFEDYHYALMSMEMDKLPRMDPVMMTKKEAYKRALYRGVLLRDRSITTAAKLADYSEEARNKIIDSGLFEKIIGVMREPIAYPDAGDVLCAGLIFVLNVCKIATPSTVKDLIDKYKITQLLEALVYFPDTFVATHAIKVYRFFLANPNLRPSFAKNKKIITAIVDYIHAHPALLQTISIDTIVDIATDPLYNSILIDNVINEAESLVCLEHQYTPAISEKAKQILSVLSTQFPAWFHDFKEEGRIRCDDTEDPSQKKKRAGDLFNMGDYETAARLYKEAMFFLSYSDVPTSNNPLSRYILYSNIAECRLRLKEYNETIRAATRAIAIRRSSNTDVKPFFRRARAFEENGRYFEAYNDYAMIHFDNPDESKFSEPFHRAKALLMRIQKQKEEGIRCARCKNQSVKLKKCARCHVVYYCSRECQQKDWADHKAACVS